MQSAAQRAKAQAALRQKEAVKAKPRTGAAADIGKFEQHTKGFGQKMLEKMGYVAGQGLGSKGQGISRPVEAKLRPQKAGLGAGGHSEHKLSLEVEQPKAEPAVSSSYLHAALYHPSAASCHPIACKNIVPVEELDGQTCMSKCLLMPSSYPAGSTQQAIHVLLQHNVSLVILRQHAGLLSRIIARFSQTPVIPALVGLTPCTLYTTSQAACTLQAVVKPSQPKTWKKKNAAARSARQEYKTIADVLSEVAERPLEQPKQTIIDMRGKQKRLVTNLEHLNQEQQEDTADLTPMPELQHNMRLLVDVAEADIQRIDGKLRHEKDTAVILGREQTRLQGEVEAAAQQMQSLNQILQIVSQCQSSDASITTADVEQVYSRLRQRHREEYYMYNLAAAALAQALPRLTQLLLSWRPLEDPSLGTAEFARWRALLESEQQKRNAVFQAAGGGASSDPYVQLCSAVVMPKLNRMVTNDWEPRNPEPMLQFMELWGPLLPGALQQQVLESLVFPKVGSPRPMPDHCQPDNQQLCRCYTNIMYHCTAYISSHVDVSLLPQPISAIC